MLFRSEHNPEGLFTHPKTGQDVMLCFTGGEPMLQQKAMMAILEELAHRGNMPKIITVETNATQKLSDDLRRFIALEFRMYGGKRWHWSMSPKLFNVSGETDAIIPEIIQSYTITMSTSILKFVCNGTKECWEELDMQMERIRFLCNQFTPHVWVMPVGATKNAQEESSIGDLCIEAMNRGYNVATRNHCYVFGNIIGR